MAKRLRKPKAPKKRNGRPPHQPDDRSRNFVKAMASYGHTKEQIAEVLGLAKSTVVVHYRRELATGHIEANAQVAQSLFQIATAKGNVPQKVAAAIFWLKTRAGWRERDRDTDPENPNGGEVIRIIGGLPKKP